MTILGMDTSGPVAGVAIWNEGKIAYSATANVGLTHSETLMPMVDQALSACGFTMADVGLVACVAGPGSFTGVRIGVCAARAIALARGIPCAGIDALEALAAGAFGFEGEICPILDARRGQVYCARFSFSEGARPKRLCEDHAVSIMEFLGEISPERRAIFTGDGLCAHSEAIKKALGDRAILQKPYLSLLRAEAACYLAACDTGAWASGEALLPIYLRKPQAERELLERRGERHD